MAYRAGPFEEEPSQPREGATRPIAGGAATYSQASSTGAGSRFSPGRKGGEQQTDSSIPGESSSASKNRGRGGHADP